MDIWELVEFQLRLNTYKTNWQQALKENRDDSATLYVDMIDWVVSEQ